MTTSAILSSHPRALWRTLLVWGGSIFIATGLCFALYTREARQLEQSLRDREIVRVGLFARLLEADLLGVAADLRVFAQSDTLQDFLDAGQTGQRDRLAKEWQPFSSRQNGYDQIRYLDETGMERIRVSLADGIVP